jgi:hypothetical protein
MSSHSQEIYLLLFRRNRVEFSSFWLSFSCVLPKIVERGSLWNNLKKSSESVDRYLLFLTFVSCMLGKKIKSAIRAHFLRTYNTC